MNRIMYQQRETMRKKAADTGAEEHNDGIEKFTRGVQP